MRLTEFQRKWEPVTRNRMRSPVSWMRNSLRKIFVDFSPGLSRVNERKSFIPTNVCAARRIAPEAPLLDGAREVGVRGGDDPGHQSVEPLSRSLFIA